MLPMKNDEEPNFYTYTLQHKVLSIYKKAITQI